MGGWVQVIWEQNFVMVVIVADGDAAIAVMEIGWKTDGILVGLLLPDPPSLRRRIDDRVAQHAADGRNGQGLEVECAGRRRPIGQEHPPLLVESDFGNFSWAGQWGHRDFDHRVVAERAVGFQADRKSTRLNSSHLGISYAVFC